MLSFQKFAGAGIRPLQPPLFSVFPQSAPVWGWGGGGGGGGEGRGGGVGGGGGGGGACAVSALAGCWRGAFSEGGRNWFEPVLTWLY